MWILKSQITTIDDVDTAGERVVGACDGAVEYSRE